MKRVTLGVLGALGVVLTVAGLVAQKTGATSVAIIGGADGPTAIFLAGGMALGHSLVLVVIGGGIIVAAIVLFLKNRKNPMA